MDVRDQFKAILKRNFKAAGSTSFGSEAINFSLSVAPSMLYRYRGCNKRNLFQLENGDFAFSRPATFHDDPEDAYVPFSSTPIDQLIKWACDPLYEWFRKLIQMAPEERSLEISSQFPEFKMTTGLFDGVTAPWLNTNPVNLDGMTADETKAAIAKTFHDMVMSVDAADACNMLRQETMVACLCQNPDSDRMWEEYAGEGTGFQIGYSRQALFGMRICTNNSPLPYVLPVVYEDSRPLLSVAAVILALEQFGLRLPDNHPLLNHQAVCTFIALYVKDKKLFSHEQEWRVTAVEQTVNEVALDYTSRKCPCSFIRLGKYVSADDEAELRRIGKTISVPVLAYGDNLPASVTSS